MAMGYRDLVVWQRAVQLTLSVYRCTEAFPKQETYGLTSQIRRAAVSIPSNIAESYGRSSRKEYRQFLAVARGSNMELQTQFLIARELGFTSISKVETIESLSEEVGRMLSAALRRLHAPTRDSS